MSASNWPSWADAKRVCVDIETKDPGIKKLGPGVRRDGYVIGVAFAIENGPALYLPTRHDAGTNFDEEQVYQYLRDQAKHFRGELVGMNLGYDLDYLGTQHQVEFKPSFFRDVMIADPLINEHHNSYSLENISKRWGHEGKPTDGIIEAVEKRLNRKLRRYEKPQAFLWMCSPEEIHEYVMGDVDLPLKVLRQQEEVIEKENLRGIFDLESRVFPALLRMTQRGVRIDMEELQSAQDWAQNEQDIAQRAIVKAVSVKFDDDHAPVWEAEKMGEVLASLELSFGYNDDGSPRITKESLSEYDHPVARLILRARKFSKLGGTYIGQIRNHLVGDRIHCGFFQMRGERPDGKTGGPGPGRMSIVRPSLQNQPNPKKDAEIGPRWRKIFVADPGEIWASADYSQQEVRLTYHYAYKLKLEGALAVVERYREDPATDSHQMMAELTGLPRDDAKAIFLGLCYGMGGGKLCRQLGLPTEFGTWKGRQCEFAGPEGKKILDGFHAAVPFLRGMSRKLQDVAKQRGYIKTLLGRRIRFRKNEETGERWFTYKALNNLIQGSAADQTKQAIVDCDARGLPLQLPVHDELNASVPDKDTGILMAKIMRDCVPLELPSKVDAGFGPSWGHAKQ